MFTVVYAIALSVGKPSALACVVGEDCLRVTLMSTTSGASGPLGIGKAYTVPAIDTDASERGLAQRHQTLDQAGSAWNESTNT